MRTANNFLGSKMYKDFVSKKCMMQNVCKIFAARWRKQRKVLKMFLKFHIYYNIDGKYV